MDEAAVWATIDRERASLADLLDDLGPQEWDVPSLCGGWRVRDVAAHLTLAHMGTLDAVRELARARGGFNRMIHDTAVRRAAAMSVADCAAALRTMVGSRRKAPGVTHLEPLTDVLVHGQDMVVPLGRQRPMPPEPSAAAAARVWSMGFPFHARRRLSDVRLRATDSDWAVGAGPEITGTTGALLLLVTGRTTAALPLLDGPGLAAVAARR
jgi:uncharacterized protein (TIGR03083 family)